MLGNPTPPPERLEPFTRLRLVNSITELSTSDAGVVAVSGSHGGVSAAGYALAVKPVLSVFNDAGVGRNQAGIAALALLHDHGLAACTVSHESACIGQAHSTWETGVISHANAPAQALGLRPGQPLQPSVHRAFPRLTDAP